MIVRSALLSAVWTIGAVHASPAPEHRTSVVELRESGDLSLQRRHVWDVFTQLVTNPATHGLPEFETWMGEGAVFGTKHDYGAPGVRGFSREGADALAFASRGSAFAQSGSVPVLTYTLYNAAAFEHVRANRFYSRTRLEAQRADGFAAVDGRRAEVTPFPNGSSILKTVWWPVAKRGFTALPVWDPERNPPRVGGNGYTSWQRVVAVDPGTGLRRPQAIALEFAGRRFDNVRRIPLTAFHHVTVDAHMAQQVMKDPESQKAVLIALGRPIDVGDYLVLVGANLAARAVDDWVWAAFWWHDRADKGPFAVERPKGLQAPWNAFLMQAAFDAVTPVERDGSPHICFNPWLEARFPDGGHGGGTVSNCVACHQRASFPPVNFLPIRRAAVEESDPALGPGQLRTNSVWSIALHANP